MREKCILKMLLNSEGAFHAYLTNRKKKKMNNSHIRRFKSKLLACSVSRNFHLAKLEWKHVETYFPEDGEFGTCICGHLIIEHCVIRNIHNGISLIVGNCCVKKILNIDVSKNFSAMRRVLKDITKPLNLSCLQEALINKTINNTEYIFYSETWRKRNLSSKQIKWRIAINEKILRTKKMTIELETICTKICMELNRFPGLGNAWTNCDSRWPGKVAIKLEQVGDVWIPVKGQEFYDWITDPKRTLKDVLQIIHRKQKSLNKKRTHNNG